MKGLAATFILFLLIGGHQAPVTLKETQQVKETIVAIVPRAVLIPVPDSIINIVKREEPVIKTGSLHPNAVVAYAKTLIGIPYLYGSTDPKKGFDCSGFITYVFNHFKVKVPRSSVEFTDVGTDVDYLRSRPGDLILFTGTDSTIRVVGHMGIVVSNENNKIQFIHSTSGKQYGVTVTEFSTYYLTRFVRIARVFPDTPETIAVNGKEGEEGIEGKVVKKGTKASAVKKTSKLKSSKKIISTKAGKTKSVVKNTKSKKTSVTASKTSTVKKPSKIKKSSVKKPATITKKSTKATPQKKKTVTASSSKQAAIQKKQ
jgi:hypothetical protein